MLEKSNDNLKQIDEWNAITYLTDDQVTRIIDEKVEKARAYLTVRNHSIEE